MDLLARLLPTMRKAEASQGGPLRLHGPTIPALAIPSGSQMLAATSDRIGEIPAWHDRVSVRGGLGEPPGLQRTLGVDGGENAPTAVLWFPPLGHWAAS